MNGIIVYIQNSQRRVPSKRLLFLLLIHLTGKGNEIYKGHLKKKEDVGHSEVSRPVCQEPRQGRWAEPRDRGPGVRPRGVRPRGGLYGPVISANHAHLTKPKFSSVTRDLDTTSRRVVVRDRGRKISSDNGPTSSPVRLAHYTDVFNSTKEKEKKRKGQAHAVLLI